MGDEQNSGEVAVDNAAHGQNVAAVQKPPMLALIYLAPNGSNASDITHVRLTTAELIERYRDSPTLLHLSSSLMTAPTKSEQVYIKGFNLGGRPLGIWYTRGSTWLEFIRDLNSRNYPSCCNLYEIKLKPSAKILTIENNEDLMAFDKAFPSYWLNMDFFDVIFVDYSTNVEYRWVRRRDLATILNTLTTTVPDLATLEKLGVVYTTPEAARKHPFYSMGQSSDLLERFKYKDWRAVAKKYQGVDFAMWDINDHDQMKYIWYQSLDVASACIWDPDAIESMTLLYQRVGDDWT